MTEFQFSSDAGLYFSSLMGSKVIGVWSWPFRSA